MSEPGPSVTIVGAGPAGLALALMLARRRIASRLIDARTLEQSAADRRLLALSRGTLELLAPLVDLAATPTAPIRRVVVSSAGEFGRVDIGPDDLGPQPLGLTVRYGDLVRPLAQACASQPLIEVQRPVRAVAVRQEPRRVAVDLDSGAHCSASVLVNAEGTAGAAESATDSVALIADLRVEGPTAGTAFERFTREGPLALLPLPARADGAAARNEGDHAGSARAGAGQRSAGAARPLALVWCMAAEAAARRQSLADTDFIGELQAALGRHTGRIVQAGPRISYALREQSRERLREHRIVWVGNAAQTLHPVAGQGLNLGLRDCAELADRLAHAHAAGHDLETALAGYERRRRLDRAAVLALTRSMPALFATRAAPVAFGRSAALTVLSAVPELRRQFARLLMFGVRA